ncbi:hypothetical protein [Chitinibacter tainanensis]|uniref:hypothetical protein n=1 Tax=Chitinibacter tainanensis TaxID=230667 RepID=UPI00041094C6|nr:hypothetical protein [Chitinibacter tainanensis]
MFEKLKAYAWLIKIVAVAAAIAALAFMIDRNARQDVNEQWEKKEAQKQLKEIMNEIADQAIVFHGNDRIVASLVASASARAERFDHIKEIHREISKPQRLPASIASAVAIAAEPDGCGDYLNLRTVRLLNDALQNREPRDRERSTEKAPEECSTVSRAAVEDKLIELASQYHELADSQNALLDAIEINEITQ